MENLSFDSLYATPIPASPTAGVTGSARSILARHMSTVFRNLILDALNDPKLSKNFDNCFELSTQYTWVACVNMNKLDQGGLCQIQIKRVVYEHETDFFDPVEKLKPMVSWCNGNTMCFIVPRRQTQYTPDSVVFPHEYTDEEHREMTVGKFYRLAFDLKLDISSL